MKRHWAVCDYYVPDNECITAEPEMFWTHRGAWRHAALLNAILGTRSGQFEARVEWIA